MDRAKTRPPNIADGMILIGAAALGLWFSAWRVRILPEYGPSPRTLAGVWSGYLVMTYPLIWIVSQTVLILRLRGPRPTWLRLRRQPGFVASVAVALMSVLQTAYSSLPGAWSQVWLEGRYIYYVLWMNRFLNGMTHPDSIAPGVIVAWCVQVMLGAWRPEPSWIDRFGRAVGWTWIGLWIAATILRQFSPW